MLFNSITYFVFFGIVLVLYYSFSHRWQNRMLLVASYVFYGWWDWRFLSLILISTVADYICGMQIHRRRTGWEKRAFLWMSVGVNLGLLGFFKYWDFFVGSFSALLTSVGFQPSLSTLNIILPVGISFYTFQTMSYSIDIYRGKLEPTDDFFDFALFVAFFPQLVAGPIERAKSLLPQIRNPRHFVSREFTEGLHLIFWGLVKKVFVADNLGRIVDHIYTNPSATGWDYVVATWAFAFQIYGDFSGYTDVARGSAKCLGIHLMENFRQPYFATSPRDLWRRWHISLSTWLRDYLYISLGGNRKGKWKTQRNLFLTMLLGGLWHGAAWTFVLWGAYHGFLLAVQRAFRPNEKRDPAGRSSLWGSLLKAAGMFQLTCLGWVFFRSQSAGQIGTILHRIFFSPWEMSQSASVLPEVSFYMAVPLLVMAFQFLKEMRPQWFSGGVLGRCADFAYLPLPAKSMVYGALAYFLCFYGAKAQSFIYFQF